MKLLVYLIVPLVLCHARPQGDEVTADDITRSSGGSYDQTDSQVDGNLLKELFGGSTGDQGGNEANNVNQGYTPPNQEKIKVDTTYEDCSFYEEDGYRCVSYHLCDDNGEIITDGGPGLIDLRFGGIELDPDNSKCPGDLEVCCRLPKDADKPLKPKSLPYTSKCGTRNIEGIGVRISNDRYQANTQFGEFPYMCAILEERLINGDKKNLFVAGASLISPSVVMTAAHSVVSYNEPGANPLKVRCGEWDTQSQSEPAEHQDRYVNVIVDHPGYSNTNYSNDIALLITQEPFILSPHIDVICLPSLEEMQDSYEQKTCIATGWGKDKFDSSGEYQTILKKVELDMVPPYQCQNALRTTKLGEYFNLDPTFNCAGGSADIDTCKGDGGGPLVCPNGKNNGYGPQYVQAGIVAWGVGCGERDIPGVYTDVADSLCFIDWATRCNLGDEDHYGVAIRGCRHWATRERSRLRNAVDSYQYQVDYAENSKIKRKLTKRLFKHKEALQSYEEAINKCNLKIQDEIEDDKFDDYDDDLDISGYQRINDSLDRKTAVLKSESDPSGDDDDVDVRAAAGDVEQ